MINKLTDLLEIKCPHNHDAAAHKSEKIIISNTIKCKAEISTKTSLGRIRPRRSWLCL